METNVVLLSYSRLEAMRMWLEKASSKAIIIMIKITRIGSSYITKLIINVHHVPHYIHWARFARQYDSYCCYLAIKNQHDKSAVTGKVAKVWRMYNYTLYRPHTGQAAYMELEKRRQASKCFFIFDLSLWLQLDFRQQRSP